MKWFWFALAALVIAIDQYTKFLASTELVYLRPVEITSWFNLMLAHNEGAAFSFLSDAVRLPAGQTWLACSLALILGGAIGNLVDRATLGYVVDFISVHYGGRYFPAFNIADSGICVGAAMLIIDSFRQNDEVTA